MYVLPPGFRLQCLAHFFSQFVPSDVEVLSAGITALGGAGRAVRLTCDVTHIPDSVALPNPARCLTTHIGRPCPLQTAHSIHKVLVQLALLIQYPPRLPVARPLT
jgi:hypothetical protein